MEKLRARVSFLAAHRPRPPPRAEWTEPATQNLHGRPQPTVAVGEGASSSHFTVPSSFRFSLTGRSLFKGAHSGSPRPALSLCHRRATRGGFAQRRSTDAPPSADGRLTLGGSTRPPGWAEVTRQPVEAAAARGSAQSTPPSAPAPGPCQAGGGDEGRRAGPGPRFPSEADEGSILTHADVAGLRRHRSFLAKLRWPRRTSSRAGRAGVGQSAEAARAPQGESQGRGDTRAPAASRLRSAAQQEAGCVRGSVCGSEAWSSRALSRMATHRLSLAGGWRALSGVSLGSGRRPRPHSRVPPCLRVLSGVCASSEKRLRRF